MRPCMMPVCCMCQDQANELRPAQKTTYSVFKVGAIHSWLAENNAQILEVLFPILGIGDSESPR